MANSADPSLNSDFVFRSRSYVEALHSLLAGTNQKGARKPRGSIQRLASHLKCHASFIAQVLTGKANFSVDQAILAAEFFELDPKSKDHFLDLLLLDRSSAPAAKGFYAEKIEKRIKDSENLAKRWEVNQDLPENLNWEFFSSHLHQIAYSLLHIEKFQSTKTLSEALRLSVDQTKSVLRILKRLQLLNADKGKLKPRKSWMHLSKDSPVIRSHHQSWRLRSIEEFSKSGELAGFHYSGAITLTEEDAKELHRELLRFLDGVRKRVANSSSEGAYALGLDFFSLI